MKRFIAIILILAFSVLSLCACGTPKPSPVEDFTYQLKDGKAYITGYIGTDLNIVIPSEIEGRPVTAIAYNEEEEKGAFEGYDMTSIIIPEGVELIEEHAFEDCIMLENISLPDSFKCFYRGTYSVSVSSAYDGLYYTKWYQNQPDGLIYNNNILLGIKGNNDLVTGDINIKKGTVCIAGEAFEDADNITNVTIPDSVKYIGNRAFYDCDLLNKIEVPNGTTVCEGFTNKAYVGNVSLEPMPEI